MTPSVVILGGGPGGAVAAMTLARAGLDVTVLDAGDGLRPKVGETLPPTVRPLLERLGLVDRLDTAEHRRSFGNRSTWGSEQPTEEDFLRGGLGPGWHLDRTNFEVMLRDVALEAGALWLGDHHAVDAHRRDHRWIVELEGPEALIDLTADFVIDATGRPGRFARGAGASRRHFDRLVGVAVTLDGADADAVLDGFTLVEAVPDGWWYSAPLADERVVAVYMTDGDLLDRARMGTSSGWHDQLGEAANTWERLRPWLGTTEPTDVQPRILAAGSACLDSPVGVGWLAVGDAAASFDPLSSHGIGSAMTTGYYGACAVADTLGGNVEALDAYAGLVASLFADYLQLLHEHYLDEQRWPDNTFWSRRHNPPSPHQR